MRNTVSVIGQYMKVLDDDLNVPMGTIIAHEISKDLFTDLGLIECRGQKLDKDKYPAFYELMGDHFSTPKFVPSMKLWHRILRKLKIKDEQIPNPDYKGFCLPDLRPRYNG